MRAEAGVYRSAVPAKPDSLVRGNIMVVDDNPANLKLLEGMLLQQGYEVCSFPNGRLALAAAAQQPDLILLDINMPEMNGYEVCERLKAREKVSGIPVIFLSALNETEDKVKGFRSGAVDYISKPFQFEEVQARVETHLKLRRAQQVEHDLLEKTLSGAIGTLSDLVQLTSPVVAARSLAIREMVRWITKRTGIADAWQYDLAATLCFMGCLTLPEETFTRAYRGQLLSPAESAMFRAHPERTAGLLCKIPRLEGIAEMIRRQQRPQADPDVSDEINRGAGMLHLVVALDQKVYRGISFRAAIDELKASGTGFNPAMLDALAGYSPQPGAFEVQSVGVSDLRQGMILDEPVLSTTNVTILNKGTILSDTWIARITNFAASVGVREPVRVRVPSPGSGASTPPGSVTPVTRPGRTV